MTEEAMMTPIEGAESIKTSFSSFSRLPLLVSIALSVPREPQTNLCYNKANPKVPVEM
jgi:hypothetical protein